MAQRRVERPQLVEPVEHQAHRRLHLLVRIDHHVPGAQTDVADGDVTEQLAPTRLVQAPLVDPLMQHVQSGFAQRPLEPQQQSVELQYGWTIETFFSMLKRLLDAFLRAAKRWSRHWERCLKAITVNLMLLAAASAGQ